MLYTLGLKDMVDKKLLYRRQRFKGLKFDLGKTLWKSKREFNYGMVSARIKQRSRQKTSIEDKQICRREKSVKIH